jgi:drug/metabolite transporter (DMT)-like permease
MVGGSLSGGHWIGNLLALGSSCSFAIVLVLLRRAGRVDMLPGALWGAIVSLSVGGLLAHDLWISPTDIGWAMAFGSVNMTLGLALVTLGARHVPAAETALIGLTESVLAPVWVWLFLAEDPGVLTLVGGTVVLAAVAGQVIVGRRAAA